MKFFKDPIKYIKNRTDIKSRLKVYKEFILKKQNEDDLNSALDKARSALTLIKEYENKFDLSKETELFESLNNSLTSKLQNYRDQYVKQLKKNMNRDLTEQNIEEILKALAKLKDKVDQVADIYNLYDVQNDINDYFEFVKKLFMILGSYKIIDYHNASEQIYELLDELKSHDFPNLTKFVERLLNILFNLKISQIAQQYDRISINELRDKLELSRYDLIELIKKIIKKKNSPIKVYNETAMQVIFRT